MTDQLISILLTGVGIVATGLFTWLTAMITAWLNSKIKNQKMAQMATTTTQIVMSAVQSVFQTYVEAIKKEGKFGDAEKEEARRQCLEIINSQLTGELLDYLKSNFGDVQEYLKKQIEAVIYQLKK